MIHHGVDFFTHSCRTFKRKHTLFSLSLSVNHIKKSLRAGSRRLVTSASTREVDFLAPTLNVRCPGLPAVPPTLIYLDCTLQISIWVTWCVSIVTVAPIHVIDLPKTYIIGAASVVVCRVGVAPALVRNNAFAACLIPAAKLGAPRSNVLLIRRSPAGA